MRRGQIRQRSTQVGTSFKLRSRLPGMDSNPYSPQTTADVPLKNKGPLAAAAIVGMWFAALLALVYLTIVGMAVSECLKSPPSGISGYVQTGALSALFATICLISIVQLKARRRSLALAKRQRSNEDMSKKIKTWSITDLLVVTLVG